jgi:cell division protein FtsW (lipid II flippase)
MFVDIVALVMTTLVFLVLARLDYERRDKKLVVAGIVVLGIWFILLTNLVGKLINTVLQ